MFCSPIGDQDGISCLKLENLRNIAFELIKVGVSLTPTYINSCNKTQLYNTIGSYFEKENLCKDENCWSTTDIVQKSVKNINDLFIPIMPDKWRDKPSEWLNTTDIDNVLNQYAKAYKNFHYTGAVPIDFDLKAKDGYCEVSDICKISIPQLYKKGIRKIGLVFNTDPSTKDGEHWISAYIDLNGIDRQVLLGGVPGRMNREIGGRKKKKTRKSRMRKKVNKTKRNRKDKKVYGMYFFDSTSDPAPKQIIDLFNRLKKQAKKININLEFFENDIQHQMGNNECGVYCLYFVSNMLKDKSYFKIIEDIKRDKDMHEFRKVFFRPNTKKT
jgi:hypothetical protein